VTQLSVNPVHFVVIVVMNLMIGLISQPFDFALFVVAKVGDIPYRDLAWAIWPFVLQLLCVFLICTYWIWIIMAPPNMLRGVSPCDHEQSRKDSYLEPTLSLPT